MIQDKEGKSIADYLKRTKHHLTITETCMNCANPVTGNFCSGCGQKKYKRIDRKYIWDELQYTVFHTNKGFLFSIREILKNPGMTARAFIDGKRVNHYKPILLAFVLSGLAAFISYKILNLNEVMAAYFSKQHINSDFMNDVMSLLSGYTSIFMLLLVPFFALTSKIAFSKWGNNYYEHVVMNAYILSFYTLVTIFLVYPILYFFRHAPGAFFNITQLSILLIPAILIWFFKEFYQNKSLKTIIWKVFGVLGLTILGYLIFTVIVAGIGVAIATSDGNTGTLEYLKPK